MLLGLFGVNQVLSAVGVTWFKAGSKCSVSVVGVIWYKAGPQCSVSVVGVIWYKAYKAGPQRSSVWLIWFNLSH
jgi:hypothetical protein